MKTLKNTSLGDASVFKMKQIHQFWGKGKATETVRLLLVSSFWYQEVQIKYSETNKYLHSVRLGHHSKWERNILLYWAMRWGNCIPKSKRHKQMIYKRKRRKYHVICWNCCKVMKAIYRNSHNSPRNTICTIPSIAEENWHGQSIKLKALSASPAFFCPVA